jgi:hypothetical protein
VILAELEVFHSRPVAPTRRVALGDSLLPVDPPPGLGSVLLGGVVATHAPHIDAEMLGDVRRLTHQLEHGQRIAQPRLRHRLQQDRIGLTRSVLRLVGSGNRLAFDFEDKAASAQYVLGAVYAAGTIDPGVRPAVFETVRKGLDWFGPVDDSLIGYLAGTHGPGGWGREGFEDPVDWARRVLDLDGDGDHLDRRRVQRRFRSLLRDAHPDHGAGDDGAAERIAELSAARRILFSAS